MKIIHGSRPIDERYVPPVGGVDLEQALNYIDYDIAGEEFVYQHYTSRRLFYNPGSRPHLEQALALAMNHSRTSRNQVQSLVKWIATYVKWAGYHAKDEGMWPAKDRSPTEEQILEDGYGWCNEQARLFCLLAQINGLPARLVFASNEEAGYGHCISEVLLDDGWMAVDQSLGYCFVMSRKPVRASVISHDAKARGYFSPIYRRLCRNLINNLGEESKIEFAMAAAENPLDGFKNLGYLNYFAR